MSGGDQYEMDSRGLSVKLFQFVADAIAFILAFVFANLLFRLFDNGNNALGDVSQTLEQTRVWLYSITAVVTMAWIHGVYRHYMLRKPYWTEVRELLVLAFYVAILDATFMYLAKFSFSRITWAMNWALLLPFILVLRFVIRRILDSMGLWCRPYIVIGCGENAGEAIAAICDDRWMGYECIAALCLPSCQTNKCFGPIPLEPLEQDIDVFMKRWTGVDIFVAVEEEEWGAVRTIVDQLVLRVPNLYIIPPLRGLPLLGADVSHFFRHEVLLLRLRNNLGRRVHQYIKRASDIVLVLLGSIFLCPLLSIIALMVWRSGSSIIFAHNRVGQYGDIFKCYKFRTMVPDAQQILHDLLLVDAVARAEWEKDFKLSNDPRVTPLGLFLRKTSLDELPQLWNVFIGDMSLVGPRPVVESELSRYGEHQKYYLEAKPGITGLWQVSGRSDTDYPTRVALDVWYVKNWSLWYDLVILLKTFKVVLVRKGAC